MEKQEKSELYQAVFNSMPALIFIVDRDMRIEEYNAAVATLLRVEDTTIVKQPAGEILHCLHSRELKTGCGKSSFCKDCIIRKSISEAFRGYHVIRRRTKIDLIQGGKKTEMYALITTSPFIFRNRALALLVIEDLNPVAELSRMLPICSFCKKIQDETKTWTMIEAYFNNNLGVDFSHGLCPDCFRIEMDKVKDRLKSH